MDKQLFERLIAEGLSQREIAERLGKSHTSIRYHLNKWSLKTSINKYNKIDGEVRCKLCDETDPDKFYTHPDGRRRFRCKACDAKEIVKRLRSYKQQAVVYKGGRCEKCGYDKCLGSLEFHHLNPKEKDPNWKRMRSWPLDKIKVELDKCQLVCRNCHGEIHWGG